MVTVVAFFIAIAFIVWFLLGGTPSTEQENKPSAPSAPAKLTGPCRGSVYRMIYQYDSSGKCVPIRCESGYTKIGGQCVFDGSDTSNVVLPSFTRGGRVAWRIGKMKL
jgi:hypothetical protein